MVPAPFFLVIRNWFAVTVDSYNCRIWLFCDISAQISRDESFQINWIFVFVCHSSDVFIPLNASQTPAPELTKWHVVLLQCDSYSPGKSSHSTSGAFQKMETDLKPISSGDWYFPLWNFTVSSCEGWVRNKSVLQIEPAGVAAVGSLHCFMRHLRLGVK